MIKIYVCILFLGTSAAPNCIDELGNEILMLNQEHKSISIHIYWANVMFLFIKNCIRFFR